MKIDEAIGRIRDHMERHGIGEYPHVKLGEALEMAIDALKNKTKEELLTLKQIEEMNIGEPVWVVKRPVHGKLVSVREAKEIIDKKDESDADEWVAYSVVPAAIKREMFQPCEYCGKEVHIGKIVENLCKRRTKNANAIQFCPMCGRPRTEKAWKLLEKRVGR